jgi:hypothetical protein
LKKILLKYLIAFITAILTVTVLHALFFTIYTDKAEKPYKRYLIKRTTAINVGSLCLYSYKNDYYMGRAVAKSGDSIIIKNGRLHVNGFVPITENAKTVYRRLCFTPHEYSLTADTLMSDSLEAVISQDSILYTELEFPPGTNQKIFFPQSHRFRWNPDNMGPLFIPGTNFKVVNTKENRILYKKQSIAEADSLSFDSDYYFIINDRRDNIADSRTFGLISANNAVGYVVYSF